MFYSRTECLAVLSRAIQDIRESKSRPFGLVDLNKSYTRLFEFFDLDQDVVARSGFLFRPHDIKGDKPNGEEYADLFAMWREEDSPGVTALLFAAGEYFRIHPDTPAFRAAVMAGIAAEVPHKNPFHNNAHFREVVGATIRRVQINNALSAGGCSDVEFLEPEDISKLLLAAVAHDLGHDGLGNAPEGLESFEQFRLERRSADMLMPFMCISGMTEGDIADVSALILSTDTKRAGRKSVSPSQHMKAIYRHHFFRAPEVSGVPSDLQALVSDKKLSQMAAILSDADLTASAGTTITFNQEQSALYAEEDPVITAGPADTLWFLENVMEGRFTSVAGHIDSQEDLNQMWQQASRLTTASEVSAARKPDPAPDGA